MQKPITEQNQSVTTSGEMVAGSKDLIEQVFIRLRADSLAEFKWVSKQSMSFIYYQCFYPKIHPYLPVFIVWPVPGLFQESCNINKT